MRTINVEQGSDAWKQERIGRVTASEMTNIIQPKNREASASQSKYLAKIMAEWMLGEPLDSYESPFMLRGSALEADAVAAYEFETDNVVQAVGLCVRDDGKVGASPDRLVGTDGVLEIKVPSIETHVGYMLDSRGLIEAYYTQVHGEMWICEREWADLVSYHPILPSVRARVKREQAFIDDLAKLVDAFVIKLDEAKANLAPLKLSRPARRVVERDPDPFATTEATEGAFL